MENNKQDSREWYIFDAKNETLGRLSTKVADILRGKHKVNFRNNLDLGDNVVIINAEKIVTTGRKEEQKRYYKHTGYLGNLRETTLSEMRKKNPAYILEHSIVGMLPQNKLQDIFAKRLKIYTGEQHPHQNVKFVNEK